MRLTDEGSEFSFLDTVNGGVKNRRRDVTNA
jgi:hypothetical protein